MVPDVEQSSLSTAPGSSRRQRGAQLNSGSCSDLGLGMVSASWGLTESCDEAPAARNANAPKATARQGGASPTCGMAAVIPEIFSADKVYLS